MDLDYLTSDKLELIKIRVLKISNQLNSFKKSISKRASDNSTDSK
jgi:hypothetical protein